MKLIGAFFRLIRWPNLLFISLTQFLFYYFVSVPIFKQNKVEPHLQPKVLLLIILASVLIAAAGYIINDYFDVNIDNINKPQKLVIEKFIKRRWAIIWHLLLSFIGIVISLKVSFIIGGFLIWHSSFIYIGLANIICVLVLLIYSTTLKRKLIIGNITISVLTAWTILILYFAEFPYFFRASVEYQMNYQMAMVKLFKLSILYSGFAFIVSLIREVIKDLEDMDGDRKYNCTTMPIAWGVPVTKVFVAVWLVVLISVLIILQFYVLQFKWWGTIFFCITFIIAPLIFVLKKLYQTVSASDYHQISSLVKWVTLFGILSMIIFKIYI